MQNNFKTVFSGLATILLLVFIMPALAMAEDDKKGLDGKQMEEFRFWRSNEENGGGRCFNMNSSWNGSSLARVLYCAKTDGDSITESSDVYNIMTTRDPAGWLNPYWITDQAATSHKGYTHSVEGSVVGKYYDRGYASWGTFLSMLRNEFSKREDVKWWAATQGTCFDEATYNEFERNCTDYSAAAESKDSVYKMLHPESKKPAKKKKKSKKS